MEKEQIILGINGYSKRVHDASACITIDGELVAMAEEERFTRKKHAFGQVPHNAIAFCLDRAGVQIDMVDSMTIGWDLDKFLGNTEQGPPREQDLVDLYLPKSKFQYSKNPSVEMVPHHLAHAASAYYLSGFDDSVILVMDGQGESQSPSVFMGNGDKISLVKEFPIEDSLGYFYEGVSEYVGLSHLDAGKTMGLAGYGDPKFSIDLIELSQDGYAIGIVQPFQSELDLQQEITNAWKDYLIDAFGPANNEVVIYDSRKGKFKKQTDFPQRYKDVSASAQQVLEKVVQHLVNAFSKDLKRNLCIAGGVGLNCSMNGAIVREGAVNELFVPPFANDAGVSVGAALYVSNKKPKSRMESSSLGPDFPNDTVVEALDSFGVNYELFEDIGREVAALLAQGRIVDWFQGRMEAGPRALGNRSILGSPIFPENHQRLNTIKTREQWRPLAPSFLAEKLADYMVDPSESPFMLRAFKVKPEKVGEIPAAVHVDGTSRAQTVTEKANHLYYGLIRDFEQLTGVPAVMNTSFNQGHEPIVCTPEDAIRTFFSSGADSLAIGNVLVRKG